MGKKRFYKKKQTASVGGSNAPITVKGQFYYVLPLSSSLNSLLINPTATMFTGTRLANYARIYGLFKFKSLLFEIDNTFTSGVGGDTVTILGYTPELDVGIPTTLLNVSEMPVSRMVTEQYTVPMFMKIPPEILSGPQVNWYQCNATGSGGASSTAVLVNQGILYLLSNNSGSGFTQIVVHYVCQFKDPGPFVAPGPQPALTSKQLLLEYYKTKEKEEAQKPPGGPMLLPPLMSSNP